MPTLAAPNDPLPPRPPPMTAPSFIVGGLVMIAFTAVCLVMDEAAFARGFPADADPLLWVDWALVVVQTLLGVIVVLTMPFMIFDEFRNFLVMHRLRRRGPEWWKLAQQRLPHISHWRHFATACLTACGAAMLWPTIRLCWTGCLNHFHLDGHLGSVYNCTQRQRICDKAQGTGVIFSNSVEMMLPGQRKGDGLFFGQSAPEGIEA